jgi:DNA-binding transcriptional MerR regulator
MIYSDSKYTKENWHFPSTDIDPKLKEQPEYCLKWAEAIYSTHIRGKSGIPYSELLNWDNQRLYGKGMQSKEKYKAIFLTEDVNQDEAYQDIGTFTQTSLESRRKGWSNVNDDIVSVAPKIKDVFHGIFDNQDYEISADTIDLNSGALKDRAKYGLLAQTLFAEDFARLRAIGNIPDTQKDFVPRNVTELEMYESAGGFKLNVAKTMEKLLRHTFDISDWDYMLKRKALDDVLDIGYIAFKEYYDEDTHKTKVGYVDPACLAIQYSKEDDYENSDWVGYYTTSTISQLEQKGFQRAELEKMAKEYSGQLGNPVRDQFIDYNTQNSLGGYDYDFYRIPIYEVQWIDANTEKYLKWTNKSGKKRIKQVGFDTDDTKFTKKEVSHSSTRVVYQAKWIIGTQQVYDYGIAHDQLRPTPSKPILSYRVVKITENPIMRRLKPIFDKMQLAWLRYQNALIMSAGGGWAINLRLLNNLNIGGQKLGVKDVLRMMRNNNVLFFSDTPVHGRYEGGSVNPVTPLPSMLKDEIQNAIQEFEYSMKQVEHITGLTPVALGGTPDERAGKATTELSFSATQNVMRPIVAGVMRGKQRIAESAMLHMQMLIRNNKYAREAYSDVVGEMDVMSIKAATHEGTRYGIKLVAKPTEQEWAEVDRLVEEAISLGRDGVKSLEIDDALYIRQARSSGMNIKEIRMMLSFKIQKYKDEQQQKALQTQKMQMDGAQQLEAQKAQKEAQMKQMDAEIEQGKLQQEHQGKLKEINLQGNIDTKRDVMKFAHDENMAKMKPKTSGGE